MPSIIINNHKKNDSSALPVSYLAASLILLLLAFRESSFRMFSSSLWLSIGLPPIMYNSTFLLSAQLHTITAHQNINAAAIHIMSAISFFLCAVCCFAAMSSCAAAPKATTAFRCPCNFTSMLHSPVAVCRVNSSLLVSAEGP